MIADLGIKAGGAMIDVVSGGIGAAISEDMKKESQITGLATFLGKEGAVEAFNNNIQRCWSSFMNG